MFSLFPEDDGRRNELVRAVLWNSECFLHHYLLSAKIISDLVGFYTNFHFALLRNARCQNTFKCLIFLLVNMTF